MLALRETNTENLSSCATRNPGLRRSFYYRPKGEIALSRWTLRKHLLGEITIGLYAINPSTQKCKWVAIDADYAQALPDLLKLQWELKQEGIDSAIERSRRGGHLWILAAKPILARNCRIYVHELARRLHVPIRDMCTSKRPDDSDISCGKSKFCEGIEVFPKPCKYCCWAGCRKEQIRAALGRPIRLRPGCK
jgi:hypothetical protein